MVRPYEIVYIIDPDVTETDSAALVERFRALAEAQGATDLRVDTHTLGKRRLAYVIDHKREGHYVVMDFQSEAKAPAEVERVLNITDGILRAMVVRLDAMPPEPEAAPAPAPPASPETVEQPASEPEATEEPAPAPEIEEEPAPAPEIEEEPSPTPETEEEPDVTPLSEEEPEPAPAPPTEDAEEPATELEETKE